MLSSEELPSLIVWKEYFRAFSTEVIFSFSSQKSSHEVLAILKQHVPIAYHLEIRGFDENLCMLQHLKYSPLSPPKKPKQNKKLLNLW